MAVFYQREKSKIGTSTGTILNWSKQLTSNDPDDQNNQDELPAGYLRCDGGIYSAEIFPELAEILGVGQLSRYRKPTQTLLDNQFQLPDLGSKKIRASSGANLGDYIDLYLEDDNDPPNTIVKSGVGLDVQSNIGTSYEILYQGNFFLPGQQIEITGQPGFTRTTGNYTETIDVLQTAIMPHAHFHDGTRTRVASAVGNEFAMFAKNSYTRKSTLCIQEWSENTKQDLCYLNATRQAIAANSVVQSQSAGGCRKTYYNACFSGCEFLASNQCLIPTGYAGQFPVWSGQNAGCGGSSGSTESYTYGTITYTGTMAVKCEGIGWPGCWLGGFLANPVTGPITLAPNYTDLNVPYDSFADSTTNDYYGAVNNTVTQTEATGNDGSHRHFVNFSATNHTYVVNTNPSFIPAIDVKSTISIAVNSENKADSFVQPYIVQEFLIKY